MSGKKALSKKSNMIIYTTEDGLTKIETTFDGDTVWLSIDQTEKRIELIFIILMLLFRLAIV